MKLGNILQKTKLMQFLLTPNWPLGKQKILKFIGQMFITKNHSTKTKIRWMIQISNRMLVTRKIIKPTQIKKPFEFLTDLQWFYKFLPKGRKQKWQDCKSSFVFCNSLKRNWWEMVVAHSAHISIFLKGIWWMPSNLFFYSPFYWIILVCSLKIKIFNQIKKSIHGNREMKLEVVSAKQRRATGVMSGSGETQLEAERRLINDKESKIRKRVGFRSK